MVRCFGFGLHWLGLGLPLWCKVQPCFPLASISWLRAFVRGSSFTRIAAGLPNSSGWRVADIKTTCPVCQKVQRCRMLWLTDRFSGACVCVCVSVCVCVCVCVCVSVCLTTCFPTTGMGLRPFEEVHQELGKQKEHLHVGRPLMHLSENGSALKKTATRFASSMTTCVKLPKCSGFAKNQVKT